MVTIIFRCYSRLAIDEVIIKYISDQFAISSTGKKKNHNIIKKLIIVVCGFSSQVVDHNLFWKVGNKLYPVTYKEALDDFLQYVLNA